MQAIIDLVTVVFKFLFIDYDMTNFEADLVTPIIDGGAVVAISEKILGDPLLMVPVVLLLVGLAFGAFRRIVSMVR